jgi:hypothetical protein
MSTNHAWPTNPDEHVWSRWMAQSGPPQSAHTQYRICVHPDCHAYEDRAVPNA